MYDKFDALEFARTKQQGLHQEARFVHAGRGPSWWNTTNAAVLSALLNRFIKNFLSDLDTQCQAKREPLRVRAYLNAVLLRAEEP